MNTASHGAVAIQRDEQHPVVVAADAYLDMIERAARDPNVDIDKIERLMAMRERMMDRQKKEAYSAAFAEMQSKLPPIPERGKGHNSVTYALWEDINELIKPVLSEYGFGISFRVGRSGDRLSITAVLSHRDGHSEETMIELPADSSGSKNAVQAVGSSTTYGKRYTASALLNLTSRGEDDDGVAGGRGEVITEDQVMELRALAEEVGANLDKFCAYFKIDNLASMPAGKFAAAVKALEAKRAA